MKTKDFFLSEAENGLDEINYTSYITCNYLPDQVMRLVGFTAKKEADHEKASAFIQQGYRRSGLFVYKTACLNCDRCIPVRINVNRFSFSRTQKRTYQKNADRLSARMKPLSYSDSHYQLYNRYLQVKHPASEMTTHNNPEQYQQFMLQTPMTSYLFEFSSDNIIEMVSLIDEIEDGLSAVYTFYDPFNPKFSLGIYAILWQIELVRRLQKTYLYLGYYIADCHQMSYKKGFSGLEAYIDGKWTDTTD